MRKEAWSDDPPKELLFFAPRLHLAAGYDIIRDVSPEKAWRRWMVERRGRVRWSECNPRNRALKKQKQREKKTNEITAKNSAWGGG